MKKPYFGFLTAFALLAFAATANPILTSNTVGKSSLHPTIMHLAQPGWDQGILENGIPPGNPVTGPDPHVPTIPEPTTLILFGLFAMLLALRSRWANWHR